MDEQADDQPKSPSELPARSWRAVLRRTAKELLDDELADRAAALTYYGVLSLFPALLVTVSLLGVEFDAELSRERAIASGAAGPTEEPYVEPRDTRKWPPRLRAAARRK